MTTPVPERFICPPDHKHAATGTCYVFHKCRCDACRAGRSAAATSRNRQKAYGRYDHGLVDAAPVREHIQYLQSCGLGWKRIAEISGAGTTAIGSLIYGRKGGTSDPRKGEVIKRTTREKADRILAVKPDLSLLAAGAYISSRGVHRRVQALVARGWSQSKLSAMVGREPGNWFTMMQAPSVTVALHREFAEIYERLWNEEPPHADHRDKIAYSRSINYAAARRWLPPLAWDDIDTDVEPPAQEETVGIDEALVLLAIAGEQVRLTPEERRAAVTELNASRLNDSVIAERLHVTTRTVLRIRQELDLAAAVGADKQIVA